MGVRNARLLWKKAALVSIGAPEVGTLTLPMTLYDRLRPHPHVLEVYTHVQLLLDFLDRGKSPTKVRAKLEDQPVH
jgi:hypothetical protein